MKPREQQILETAIKEMIKKAALHTETNNFDSFYCFFQGGQHVRMTTFGMANN